MTVELLPFFKALADASRLKIIGLLAGQPLSVEQLADMLDLRPPTVSHHLAILAQAGLVSARAEGYYSMYRLEQGALEEAARKLLSTEGIRGAVMAEVDLEAYDRKVLSNFLTPEGRIKTFPGQRKKFEVILRYVLKVFEPGVRYSERQVNELLGKFHPDTATLRRELVSHGWLKRQSDGTSYWKEIEEGT
jgi:hypothetical protein